MTDSWPCSYVPRVTSEVKYVAHTVCADGFRSYSTFKHTCPLFSLSHYYVLSSILSHLVSSVLSLRSFFRRSLFRLFIQPFIHDRPLSFSTFSPFLYRCLHSVHSVISFAILPFLSTSSVLLFMTSVSLPSLLLVLHSLLSLVEYS